MARPDFDSILPFTAEGAIVAYSIVKFGSNDFGALQAAASTDKLAGITTEIDAASGERVDVQTDGTAFLKINGTVTRGDWITSDASGLGVTAAPATGVNAEVVGKALQSGVAGDVIEVLIEIGRIQG